MSSAAMNDATGITTLLLPAQPGLAAVSSTILLGLGTRFASASVNDCGRYS